MIAVPPALTLRSSTLRLLERFRKAAGAVVWAGTPPTLVDARLSEAARLLAAECAAAPKPDPNWRELVARRGA